MNLEEDFQEVIYGRGEGTSLLLPEYGEYFNRVKLLTDILKECSWEDHLHFSIKHVMIMQVDKLLTQVKDHFDRPYLKKL